MNNLSDKEIEELLIECDNSMEMFCKTFFPELFYKPFSPLHKELFRILDDDSIRYAAIAAPRGIGKTTIFNMAFPLKRILFRDSYYIIPVSETGDAAMEQSDDVKQELVNNELIRTLFGDLSPTDRQDPFGQKAWVTSTGCKVLPRGAGQQIRGRKYRGRRPDLIIVDDLEDDESVESQERREKLKRWFFSALLNSVDRGTRNWRVLVIGTILHEDSLLNNLLDKNKYPNWESVRLELWDDELHSKWPEHISDREIREMHQTYRENNMLDLLYREFRNIPIATEDQGFKAEYFKYYEESEDELNANPNITTAILFDPARTMSKGSADTAVVGVSVDCVANRFYVRDVVAGKFYPDELYDIVFEMADRLNALVLAPEVTGLNEYIMYPLRNEMLRRGVFHVLIEVKPRESKTGPKRSGGLVPLYRQGRVYHNKESCGVLERYLLQWPRPEKWDVIDSVSGILFVMEEGERYFSREGSEEDIEKEYEELEYEDALEFEGIV